MNNEVFLDILGELDDDIISDAALPEVPVANKKGNAKSLFLIAAAVMIFIISSFIVTENGKTINMGLYESTSESVLQNTTEYETLEEPSVTAEQTTEEPSQEITVPDVSTTAFSTVTTEILTTSANIVTNPYIDPDITHDDPSEDSTTMPEEDSTVEITSSDDEPSEPDLGLPPTEPPLMGEPVPDGPRPFFVEVPAAAFLEILPEDSFDDEKYTKAETVPWHIIDGIYGTKILPDYIPKKPPSGPSLDSLPEDEIKNGNFTVYYTEESLEVYSSQKFSIVTAEGVLTVKVSTQSFPLYKEEQSNKSNCSLIKDIPVLLLSGRLLGKNAVLDAVFQKDGIYFRVTHTGNNLNEDEFIKIIESLI